MSEVLITVVIVFGVMLVGKELILPLVKAFFEILMNSFKLLFWAFLGVIVVGAVIQMM